MSKIISTAAFLVFLPLVLNGCLFKKSDPAAATVAALPACTLSITASGVTTTECILFLTSLSQTSINSGCAAYSGVTSSKCSATSALGVCATPSNTTQSSITYYSGGVYTNATAQSDCTTTQKGTYTAD